MMFQRQSYRIFRCLNRLPSRQHCPSYPLSCVNTQKRYLVTEPQAIGMNNNEIKKSKVCPTVAQAHSFGDYLTLRQQEALRSIVFQVKSAEVYDDLQKHCSQFGSVNKAFFYQGRRHENLIIMEFEEKEAADELMKTHQFLNADYSDRSRYPEFSLDRLKAPPSLNPAARIVDLDVTSGQKRLISTALYEILLQQDTVADQIEAVFNLTSLNDLHVRVRFLALIQIEDAIRTASPNARAYPFGSSASGFGRQISDLDFVVKNHDFTVPSMAGIMEFLPGITNMMPLSNASVPIIKYYHSLLDLEADLSLDNLRAVYGTEILYCCGQLDSRLRPLIFSLRWWADRMNVTKPTAGPWIKNYGMNLLTIFYLQQLDKPILPPLADIANLERERMPNSEAKFIKDIRQLDFQTKNTSSVAELITGFIDFYANFNFAKNAIFVERGTIFEKTDFSSIDIIDLFGTENVATNVHRRYYSRLRRAFAASRSIDFDLAGATKRANESWGLVLFFKKCEEAIMKQKRRL